MTKPVLRVRNVGWRVSSAPVLEQVSFDVAPGEFVALMGRNGAGKSTLLDIIAGLRLRRKAGSCSTDRPLRRVDADRTRPPHRASATGRPRRSGDARRGARADGTLCPRRAAGSSRTRTGRSRTRPCGAATVSSSAAACARTLSGGERQRVFLAACLAQEPAAPAARRAGDVSRRRPAAAVLQRAARRGSTWHGVHRGHSRRQPRADVLHTPDRARGRAIARDLPAEAALDAPEWLRAVLVAAERATIAEHGRPWVCYQ